MGANPQGSVDIPRLGLEAFAACPLVAGRVVPCQAEGASHIAVDVRDSIPPAWTCLTFADDRFEDADSPAYPDWYTYYGPYVGDGGSGAGQNRMGILYDAQDDAASVSGAVVLMSEHQSRVFTWQGPPSGFVLVPQDVTSSHVLAYGILYPDPGPTKGMFDSHGNQTQEILGASGPDPWVTDPGFTVAGEPSLDLLPFWSMSPWAPTGMWRGSSKEPYWQWDLVQGTELAGQRLHFATTRHSNLGWGHMEGEDGLAHWGTARNAPFNVSVEADGLALNASLQPYMEFFAEFHDLADPVGITTASLLCGCRDQPLTTPEGLECAVRQGLGLVTDDVDGVQRFTIP